MSQKYYANYVGVRFVAEDFLITASMLDNPGQDPATVTPDVCMYVSPVLAKKLAHILTGSVAQYEQIFGPVGTDPNIEAMNQVAATLPPGAKLDRDERR